MRKRVTARWVNGVVAAVITVVLLAHALMGGVSAVTGLHSSFGWLVWAAVVLVGVHVVVSAVTSAQQLTDSQRPPSARKKRHLALKWVTGGVLAAVAVAHIALPKSTVAASFLMAVLAVVLAVHLCVGAKSLLKDLDIDRRYKTAFRVVVCAFVAMSVLALLVALFMRWV